MYCKNCGTELTESAKFCIHCGESVAGNEIKGDIGNNDTDSEDNVSNIFNAENTDADVENKFNIPAEASLSGESTNKNEESLNKKFKPKKSVVIAGILIVAVVAVILCGWFFSGSLIISMANSAIEKNDLDKAEGCIKYSCPIGYKNSEVNDLKIRISTARKTIKAGKECLEVNDYIGAVNAGYAAITALPNYGESQQFFEESTNSFYNWMYDLYQQGEYAEAAHGFAQLGSLAAEDTDSEKLNELREMFSEKSNEFLISAQNYYNSFEPEKASENVTIVLALDSENADAQELKAKIDSYNENKVNIDEAERFYNNGDYSNALTSFDKADDYTKNVHKELRSKIETAKYNQEIDNKYASYVGSYYAPMLEMGNDEITITKIENGKIWLEGSHEGDDFWLSYSVNGASIASGTIYVTSYGKGIDYDAIVYNDAPSETTKNITGSEIITLKNGHVYHTNSFNGDNYYLRTTTYELYKR